LSKVSSPGDAAIDWNEPHARRFKEAMDDDFGTPEAVAVLHQLANEVFQGRAQAAKTLKVLGGLLGILQQDPQAFLQGREAGIDSIERLIRDRNEARKRKDFAEADRIRKELLDKGIVLEDSAGGTTWRRA